VSFQTGQIAVFDRAGARIGTITNFSVSAARTYRFNEIEDMGFYIPRRDEAGVDIYTAALSALLKRDNLIYIENELLGMPGWGGVISSIDDADDRVTVTCLSGLSLFGDLTVPTIRQSEGTSSMLATRLVAAAGAKEGAHGDLVPTLQIDGDTDMPGIWEYEGDILQGLERLASDGLAEMYVEAVLAPDAQSMAFVVHWNAIVATVDHTATILHDGPAGQVKSSPSFLYSGLEVVNHAKMRGIPTDLGQYVDYASVRSIIQDITPEIEVTLGDPTMANYRRREDLNLTVNFGYPEALQRAMAAEIQQRYVDYFKTFVYAYHHRQGRPFLEGFEWQGPDGSNEKRLTEDRFRTINKLGHIGAVTVVTADSDTDTETADITDWSLDARFNPAGPANIAGVASDYGDPSQHYVADSAGAVYLMEEDYTTLTGWGTIPTGGGALVGIATSPASASTLWAAISTGTAVTIRWYDTNSLALIGSYTIPVNDAGDIAVDFDAGLLYIASSDGAGDILVRDISNGLALSPDRSFASGFPSPVGLTVSGGIAYIADGAGMIRMVYTANGGLAGTFDTGEPISGAMYADIENRRIYLSHSGDLSVYHAYVALATVDGPGAVDGAPGFEDILSGAFVHIVEVSDKTYKRRNTAGSSGYTIVSGDTLWGIAQNFYGSGSSWRTIYRANKTIIDATARDHGFTTNFPHWIFPGTVLTIPGPGGQSDPDPPAALTKYLIVYTPGHWVLEAIPGPPGETAIIQRTWEETHPQIVGFVNSNTCTPQKPKCIIQGEEGRVDDWDPGRDGYGIYVEEQKYITSKGHTKREGPGWYPADWDVPESNWTIGQQPWPKGEQYLADYLARRNREITIQTFHITNEGGIWEQVARGATFTLTVAEQGPVDAPTTKVIRVLAFSPSEAAGEMEITAEEWVA
jgi:LysM repeat protein